MEESSNHQHFIIFKPYGYLSQLVNNDICKHKKKLLGELYDFPEKTMAIGRLDEKSEGLLLLTTDGHMSERVRSKKVEKEYYVQLDGDISKEAIDLLKMGVEIGIHGKKYITNPCKVLNLNYIPELPERSKKIRDDRHGPTSWISITLNEGKFRQIRKMTAAVGYPTLRLVRVRVGSIQLLKMKSGAVIKVDNFFVQSRC
jgi:23S rRNA pseudouridine2457 synthase